MLELMKRHSLVIAYVLIVAVGAAGFFATQHEARLREQAECEARRDTRVVLRSVVEETGRGEPLRLTSLPQFDALTPETQDYLVALEALSRQGSTNEAFQDRALALLAVPDC